MSGGKPSFRYDPKGEQTEYAGVNLDPFVIVVLVAMLCFIALIIWMSMHGWEVPL